MMPVLRRELKAYRKGLFFWSLGMFVLIASSMAKFTTMQSQSKSVNEIFAQFPHSVQVIFGLSGFDLTTAQGYYGVLVLYIVLTITVHAILLGTGIISKEERDRTSEFLFVKPISRAKVITAKVTAGIINLIVLNLVTLVTSVWLVNYYSKTGSVTGEVLVLMLGLFMLQLIFFFIGTALAAVSKKPKLAPSIATALLLGTFVLYFIININTKLDGLKYLTPFKYFEAKPLMDAGHLDPLFVVLSLLIIASTIYATYRFYTARDLSV